MIIKILAIVITLGIFLTPTIIGVLDAWPGENDKENHSKICVIVGKIVILHAILMLTT